MMTTPSALPSLAAVDFVDKSVNVLPVILRGILDEKDIGHEFHANPPAQFAAYPADCMIQSCQAFISLMLGTHQRDIDLGMA